MQFSTQYRPTAVIARVVIVTAAMKLVSSLCTPQDTRWQVYMPTIAPVMFEGTSTSGGCSGTMCIGPGFGTPAASRLGDGVHGTTALDLSAVHAWNTNVNIEFRFSFPVAGTVEGINLYFYNIPSRNIGLPYDTVLTSSPSFIEGNQDLSQNDNQLRNVTLIPTETLMDSSFTIQFRFSNIDKIDWLLLTEVEICTTSVPSPPTPLPISFTGDTVSNISPTNINSTISLSCSVVNEGRFTWSWTLPSGVIQPPTFILDTGRTSVIEFFQITSDNSGIHQCHVDYSGLANDTGLSTMFITTLTLSGILQEENAVVTIPANYVSATLRCHLYGYLPPGEPPSISWFLDNFDAILTNDATYTIATEVGDRLIQNGGSQTRPSLISALSINLINSPVSTSRSYFCQSNQVPPPGVRQIMLIPDPLPITFTGDNISPTSINSTISLSCSVENEGRFTWNWTLPSGDIQPPTFILDTGKTSVIELSQVTSDDSGDYQCHIDDTGFGGNRRVFTITLNLEGKLQQGREIVPVTTSDDTITLRCHLYGYLSPGEPSISWFLNNDMLTNDVTYTITNEVGDHLIQNGGSQTRPSLISALSINLTNNPVSSVRAYFCHSNQVPPPGVRQIILTTATCSHQTKDAIIGVLAGCIVVLLIILVIILILKMWSRFRSVHGTEQYPMENECEGRTTAKADEHNIGLDENVAYGKSTAVRQ